MTPTQQYKNKAKQFINGVFSKSNKTYSALIADGLRIEGSIEQPCTFAFRRYHGLVCSINLQYNTSKIGESLRQLIVDKKELDLTYDQRDTLLDTLNNFINTSSVQAGIISYYGVESVTTKFNKQEICYLEIKYEGGSIVKIRLTK